MNKEIVFLDFDGVIFPFGSYNVDVSDVLAHPSRYFNTFVNAADTEAVSDLKAFLHNKDCIIISTWRYLFDRKYIEDLLAEIGLPVKGFAINHKMRQSKERDISEWLHSMEYTGDWYLIDDEDGHMPEHIAGGEHIKPDKNIGFRLKDV